MDARLALGEHDLAVPALRQLITEYPLRERLRAQLALALYRSGRQAEALREVDATRRLLVEELGVDPGRELQQLHRALLEQASEIDWRPLSGTVPPEPAPRSRLPATTSRLVGREQELERIQEVLVDDRIVTLTGAGGSGKTAPGPRRGPCRGGEKAGVARRARRGQRRPRGPVRDCGRRRCGGRRRYVRGARGRDRRPVRPARARHVRAPRGCLCDGRPPAAPGLPCAHHPDHQPPTARRGRRGGLAGSSARPPPSGRVVAGDQGVRGRSPVPRPGSRRPPGIRGRRDERRQRRRHLPGARRAPVGDRTRRSQDQGAVAGRHPRPPGRPFRPPAQDRPGRRRPPAVAAGDDSVELRPARRRPPGVLRPARRVRWTVQPRRRRPGRRRRAGERSAGAAHDGRRSVARRPRRRGQLPATRLPSSLRRRAARRRVGRRSGRPNAHGGLAG